MFLFHLYFYIYLISTKGSSLLFKLFPIYKDFITFKYLKVKNSVKIAFYSLCIVLLMNCTDINQSEKASDLEYIQLKTSLVDLNQNKVNLTSFEGKKIVINYWATWCGPCIKEMPELKRAEEILQNYNYTFLLVSDETISKINTFKNEKKFDFNFLKSINSNETNGVYSLPTTYIFDENGKKVETFVGVVAWDSEQIINKLKKL